MFELRQIQERGVAVVEFAIVGVIVLIPLLLGTIDAAFLIGQQNAARGITLTAARIAATAETGDDTEEYIARLCDSPGWIDKDTMHFDVTHDTDDGYGLVTFRYTYKPLSGFVPVFQPSEKREELRFRYEQTPLSPGGRPPRPTGTVTCG